jgi:ABC-type glycerol-3-phosphate transport system permease component
MKIKIRRICLYGILIFFSILFLLPIYLTFVNSFKSQKEIFENYYALPKTLDLSNYVNVLKGQNPYGMSSGDIARGLINSFIITLPAVGASILLGSMAGFALARYKFRLNYPIFFYILLGLYIPYQIVILPVFQILNTLGLYNTYLGMILVHTSFGIPICTFITRNFMVTIPFELQDSAKIDGCSDFSFFWRIILPLSKPALAALAIFQFTWIYNDFLFALIFTATPDVSPITVALATLKHRYAVVQWNLQSAGAFLASLPTLIVFLIFQKYFIRGILLGAVKR